MDPQTADLTLETFLGRTVDFVGGIDNEALDFSQLAEFINSDGSQGNAGYFGESLSSTPSGKLLNVIVENKRAPGHSLPESPPDSSSEHPYSPQDNNNCEPQMNPSETIYTTLGQPMYKPNLLNTMIGDNLILESHHIVVSSDQPNETQLLDNGNMLIDNDSRIMPADSGILLPEPDNRQILESSPGYAERPLLVEACPRNGNSLLRLVKNGTEYDKSQLVHLGYSSGLEMPLQPSRAPIDGNGLCEPGMENVQAVYTNLQNAPKKRKLSQEMPFVKSEPDHCSPSQLSPPGNMSTTTLDDDYASSEACLSESQYQCIRFQPFQQTSWHTLCDQNLAELPVPHYQVDADKGFNFSNADDAFVCQKKNHFQITCQVQLVGDVQFVKTPDGLQKISSFHLHFYGVKYDCPTQTIRVEQSQSDRSKKPFHPVLVELMNSQRTKVTVGRLHFSETTSNNMRKKGKPNPEQRYFQLVVGLHAHTVQGNFPIVSHASQKIIVRASNPGQFESDMEPCWQKAQAPDSIYYPGKVGVNTDRPDESLVVHGNLKVTGHIIQPSDVRAKTNIVECDSAEQLRNMRKLRIVQYDLIPGFASQLCRDSESSDTGVIAQEVARILPEAVTKAGDVVLENGTSIENFLVVNKERIFMENIGAVKELCKVTDNLEMRIDQLERINRRLTKLKRGDSLKSNSTVSSVKHSNYSHKSLKNQTYHGDDGDLFCSTKLIQMVIVVLVLIMAVCLAAITTLYLKDAARCNFFSHTPSLEATQRSLPTKKPLKTLKSRTPWPHLQPLPTTMTFHDSLPKIPFDASQILKDPTQIIGRPAECNPDEQDLENNNCQTYCCVKLPSPKELGNGYKERIPAPPPETNKTAPILELDKNKNTVPIQTNDIEKQAPRSKRDTIYEFAGRNFDNERFEVMLQGKNFNATLHNYLLLPNDGYNLTYIVPISKYMRDEFLHLIFRRLEGSVRDVEHCYNYDKPHECTTYFGNGPRKLNRLRWDQDGMVRFEVDMMGFESKLMTYRAQLRQNHNVCKLSADDVGTEFVQYNLYFYRSCDQ